MKVSNLIEELLKHDPNAIVFIATGDDGDGSGHMGTIVKMATGVYSDSTDWAGFSNPTSQEKSCIILYPYKE